jgi:hypothetical protein
MTGKHAALGCGEGEITTFDYGSPAELFMVKRKGRTRHGVGYRRFATAAEAIRFAVEDFLLSVRSARGCRSETSASAAMTTLCSAERANAKRRTAITAASHASQVVIDVCIGEFGRDRRRFSNENRGHSDENHSAAVSVAGGFGKAVI